MLDISFHGKYLPETKKNETLTHTHYKNIKKNLEKNNLNNLYNKS